MHSKRHKDIPVITTVQQNCQLEFIINHVKLSEPGSYFGALNDFNGAIKSLVNYNENMKNEG